MGREREAEATAGEGCIPFRHCDQGSPAMRPLALSAVVVASISAVAFRTAPAHAQATRTWVASLPSGGDDINPCSRTAPCKTFAAALTRTIAGGLINCVDADGFGTITITKSITIDCAGTGGGILATLGANGVTRSEERRVGKESRTGGSPE